MKKYSQKKVCLLYFENYQLGSRPKNRMMGLGGGDNKKRTIHDCALEGDIAALEILLREKPTLLRSKDDSGREALHWAVSRFHSFLPPTFLTLDCVQGAR